MAYFCAPILSRIDPDAAKRLYDDGLTDKQIAMTFCVTETAARYWRQANKLPPNHPKKEQEDYLADVKQCKKCGFWRDGQGGNTGFCFCHHLLDTGKRRVYKGSHCFSFEKRRATNE